MALVIFQGPHSVDAEELLTANELSSILSGKTWMIGGARLAWSSGGTFCFEDVAGGEGESLDPCGTWHQEDNKFCMKARDWGFDHCLLATKVGDNKFDAIMDEGGVFFSWSMP